MVVIDLDRKQARAAERAMSPQEYWDRVDASTDAPIGSWFNVAHEACDRWADDPSRVAITFRGRDTERDVWTYRRLRDASRRLAVALRADGVRPGDRVAGLFGKQPEAYVTALAVWRLGALYVPLFSGLGTSALVHRLRTATPAAVAVDQAYRGAWASAAGEAQLDARVWCVGRGEDGDGDVLRVLEHGDADIDTARTAVGDPATIMFTSGTTGDPKGCVMPQSVVLLNRPFVQHCYALDADDVMLSGADPGWSFGLYTVGFSVLATGQALVMVPGAFDPQWWLTVMGEEKVSFIGAAPSALRRLARVAEETSGLPASVSGAICAGEPLDAPLVERWRRLGGGDVRDGYGQTESAMLLANLADSPELVPGSLADVVPGFDVALLPTDGGTEPLEGAAEGVIAMRKSRYQGTLTYWGRPETWAARWRGDWFLTGDVAHRDEDGRWWFVGREDDLIVTSGYNVGPTEVEAVLLAHSAVREAAVVAAPDPDRGAVVRAVLVVDPGVDRDELVEALRSAVRERVGRHAYPRIVDFVDALPRTESGKVRRTELRRAGDATHPGKEVS